MGPAMTAAGNKHNLAVWLVCTCSKKGIWVLKHQLFLLPRERQDGCIKKEKLFKVLLSYSATAYIMPKPQQIHWIPDWSTPGLKQEN